MVAWIILLCAGLLEIVWAFAMKASQGFTRIGWTTLMMVSAAASFWLLGYAMKYLPLGTAYAVWTGIGAVGAATIGVLILKEPATILRLASIAFIVIGIAGLKLSSLETQ